MDEPATLPHLAAVIEASVVVAPQGLCFPGGRSKERHPAPAGSGKFWRGSLIIHTDSEMMLIIFRSGSFCCYLTLLGATDSIIFKLK